MKDAWFLCNREVEYTYIRNNYGSRLDRIYLKDPANHIKNNKVKHINFSDHSSVQMEINLPNIPKVG